MILEKRYVMILADKKYVGILFKMFKFFRFYWFIVTTCTTYVVYDTAMSLIISKKLSIMILF